LEATAVVAVTATETASADADVDDALRGDGERTTVDTDDAADEADMGDAGRGEPSGVLEADGGRPADEGGRTVVPRGV